MSLLSGWSFPCLTHATAHYEHVPGLWNRVRKFHWRIWDHGDCAFALVARQKVDPVTYQTNPIPAHYRCNLEVCPYCANGGQPEFEPLGISTPRWNHPRILEPSMKVESGGSRTKYYFLGLTLDSRIQEPIQIHVIFIPHNIFLDRFHDDTVQLKARGFGRSVFPSPWESSSRIQDPGCVDSVM